MRRRGLALVVWVAAAGCDDSPLFPDMAASDAAPSSPADASKPPTTPPDATLPNRHLVWNDEFDGAAGQPPDQSKWSFDVGGSGWGNQQLEYDTDRPQNVALDGAGHLAITAREEWYQGKNYTSGRINSMPHFSHAFGRFEARMQLPTGQGLWPAFWLLGNDYPTAGWPTCGEIDIMENRGQEPNTVHGTVHGPGYSAGQSISAAHNVPGAPLSAGFHVYAIEWVANRIVFSVDDFNYATITPGQIPPGKQWVFDHPFAVILDVAVGGNFVGDPSPSTPFPQTLLVDYVRVYEAIP
jgi:beta-glucanase (GH16 family)